MRVESQIKNLLKQQQYHNKNLTYLEHLEAIVKYALSNANDDIQHQKKVIYYFASH